ncbi:flavin-containing monooxygenase [Herbiconiux ginsengi]|uniref:Predicted flavoprotein CzcO associated with the cation diffusion facilitator CzcD n=1 Tax=Herbiconiux ginsengi TaxID=381665 RepID=A0A1H3TGR4_9MICO|nr:NAD(P)-binding domain-containing protein [Herbiconiux ginsengi]SDZ48855.1 Predicted flavoprotein CzcO associated with the cation diffusion facilitator CzcD [Herbiconiux ginsengi]
MSVKRVAIIGGGAAGLINAQRFTKAGADVVIFEIGTKLGGLWMFGNDSGRSSAYRSLHINTTRDATHFDEFPFRTAPKMFPSHEDMAVYLNTFADDNGLRERTRFRAEVKRVEPVVEEVDGVSVTKWSVTAADGFEGVFDTVVVATGHLTEPRMPASLSAFGGELLHSHSYTEPQPFRGKRVLVIGTGNSALDIAADLAVVAGRTVISARSPELIMPKIIFGNPVGKYEGMVKKKWLPKDTHILVRRIITRIVHGRMETWGLQTPKGRTHPISHATLVNHMAYDRVKVRPGIRTISDRAVTFTDGTREEFDTIIAATGYDLSFPFFDESIVSLDSGGSLNLYGRAVSPRWPGLYFAGYFNTTGLSNLRIDDYQSRWFVALETGKTILPDLATMRAEIDEVKVWVKRRYPNTPRYAFELDPPLYLKFLQQEERLGPKRIAESGRPAAFLAANRSAADRSTLRSASAA